MDETNTVTMEQANISALMDALQSAGYHIGTGNQQIIINADGQAMVVDPQVSNAFGHVGVVVLHIVVHLYIYLLLEYMWYFSMPLCKLLVCDFCITCLQCQTDRIYFH